MSTVVVTKNDVVLTEKEVEIIRLFSEGNTSADIGKKMKLSSRTIESKAALLRKVFNSKNIVHLTCTFMRRGLIK